MTFAQILKFVTAALQVVLPAVPAEGTAGALAQMVLKILPLLSQMQAQMHSFGAAPTAALPHPAGMPGLPPERDWTPEGLTAWADQNRDSLTP